MICTERMEELVENARSGGRPGAALEAHLASCSECNERWQAERELTSQFRVMKIHALARRPASVPRVLDRNGQMLLQEFQRRHRKTVPGPAWAWGLAVAAALLLAVGAGRELGMRSNRAVSPVRPATGMTHGVRQSGAVLYEVSADAGSLSSDEDFVEVPYAPPLATGEMVRVVRTDLQPEALASMGIDVNPEWAGDMAADVVVGQDGFPRAVRLAERVQ